MSETGAMGTGSATLGTDVSAPAETTTARSIEAGLELGGRYRLVAPLGRGGMGEVWEAVHTVLGRTVAIKLVLAGATDRGLATRLQREAELVARLEHPNIVAVTDFGVVTEQQPFVVMERLHGRTLSELLRERGPLPWTQAREIAVQIATGLTCAHQAGIVHRDLKPSNVFVLDDPYDRLPIKLIDFGLAKATQLGPGDRALTQSGAVFGTPAYMAPEMIRGERIGARVDLYALGAIVYEMIVGERLWQRGTVPQLLYCHLFEPAPTIRSRVPDVPEDLDVLVARCLCKDAALRPVDSDALRLELVGVGTGKGATLVPDERMPVPAPELRARYATAVPIDRVMPIVPIDRPRATARSRSRSWRWLVPVAIAGGLVLAGLVALRVLRDEGAAVPSDGVPSEAERDESVTSPEIAVPVPRRDDAPAVAAPPAGETIAAPPTGEVIATPPTGETVPTPPKPMRKSKRSQRNSSDTPEPVEPEPAAPEPTPAIPKRNGEIYDWPTPVER